MLKNWRGQTGTVVPFSQSAEDARCEPSAGQQANGEVATDSDDVAAVAAGRRRRPAWLGIVPEVAVLAFCALLYSRTGDFDTTVEGPGPAVYPRLLIGLLAVAMFVRIGQSLLELRKGRADTGGNAAPAGTVAEEGGEPGESAISIVRVWHAIALSVGYVVATLYLGWVVGTFVFLVVFLFLTGKRRLWLTIPLSAGLTVGLAYVFVKVVYIALPSGVGIFDLFTVRLLQAIGAY